MLRLSRSPRLIGRNLRNPLLASQKRSFALDPASIVDTLTTSLQLLHAASGIPWWALIPLTTFGLRGVWTFPLAVLQRLRVQKQTALRPIVSATAPVVRLNLAKKALEAAQKMALGSEPAVTRLLLPLNQMRYEEIMVLSAKEVRKRQKKLFRDHGVQLYKNMFLPAAQIPLWVCMSITFRNLSGWSSWDVLSNKPLDPSLYTEGILWFGDLTVLDSLHIFPLALGAVALINAEWTFKTLDLMKEYTPKRAIRTTFTDSLANVSRMTVVFLMAISLHAPSALTLYWLSSQLFSLVQNVFLDLVFPASFTPKRRLDLRKLTSVEAKDVMSENAMPKEPTVNNP
ncbi:hypothetical protein PUMCH_000855 [Australozyma saopauloensis]|uniref:Membrane insertase YidC/Oxa/ALB C-terminal domain-containing protein n=1 Tax=Australozyma saopauloensis TaxID=291208 RepID=A0AAX4H530_9ASCO|nr:hypothetical protein PUMCH_000855 [[Candida] saopauloensis]